MKFNLYDLKYTDSNINSKKITKDKVSPVVLTLINSIEREILIEYLKKQEGKIGIKSLGNELRYNQNLKEIFSNIHEGNIIIKTTENRRAFIKNFLENYVEHYNEVIYFLILENNFGCESKLVDNSFIRLKEIEDELSMFFEYFNPIMEFPRIKIIEMKGFENYFIESIDGFSKLQKNQ